MNTTQYIITSLNTHVVEKSSILINQKSLNTH